jgi:hypothetical protein
LISKEKVPVFYLTITITIINTLPRTSPLPPDTTFTSLPPPSLTTKPAVLISYNTTTTTTTVITASTTYSTPSL